jgi:glycosyltransferase involved in cell wall biosynthesis
MPEISPEAPSRKGITLHGLSIDLRTSSPQSIKVEYTPLPDLKDLFNERLDQEIYDLFFPLALRDEISDSHSLLLIVRSMLRMKKNDDAFELLTLHIDSVYLNRNLLFEFVLLSSKQGQYSVMKKAISALELRFNENGLHSKVLQAYLISPTPNAEVDVYIQRMKKHLGINADYDILRAAFNARIWDLALKVAASISPSPRNHLLALRTFNRVGNKESAQQLIIRMKPRDFTSSQILEIIRTGLQFFDEEYMEPWLLASSLSPSEIQIEISRSHFLNAIEESDFEFAVTQLKHLLPAGEVTKRQILSLLRIEIQNIEHSLQCLLKVGGSNPLALASIIEFGSKFGASFLAEKAYERLLSMALCSPDSHESITHLISASIASSDYRFLKQTHTHLPSFSRKLEVIHQFANYFEKIHVLLGYDGLSKPPTGQNFVEVMILKHIIREHINPSFYTHREKHVIVVNNSLKFGGAERQVVRSLAASTFSKSLVLWNHGVNTSANSFIEEVEQFGIEILDYSIDTKPDVVNFPVVIDELLEQITYSTPFNPGIIRKIRNLVAILVEQRPEAMHLWQDTTNVLGAICGLIAGVPRIVMSARSLPPFTVENSTFPEKGPNYFFNNRFVRAIYQELLKKPNVFLCHNSENGLEKYVEWLGGFEEKMLLLRNGFEFEYKTPQDRTRDNNKPLVVGVVFRFVEVKQPMLWLEVASKVSESMENVVFRMVGDGPLLEQAMTYASELGIDSKVEFMGYRDDVELLLPEFDLFLLTSSIEGLPNVLIEAQSAGVPVVSTNAGGASETFLNHQTGILVETNSSDDLAGAVCKILKNTDYRLNAKSMGVEFVNKRFSVRSMHHQLHQILFEEIP